ncbi:MAG: GNAT family N-acetyltransferase [Bacteroidetes bacterium]|nr:GNAT family N-acetyltransferase [Bacteroidota bacterium]
MDEKKIIIRKAKKEDCAGALALIKELALFEKAPEEVTNTVYDMEQDGFGAQPVFQMHVAECENKIVGIAIYFTKYSTWKGKGVYLDDIVVTESMRGKKIGRQLFDAVIEHCNAIGAKQLHWQVLDWNEPAISFYKKYNADLDPEWINGKLNHNQLKQYMA